MSYTQLMKLFLILGLISYSYEYNLQNNYIRRRTRDADLKPNAQHIIDKIFGDQGQLESKIRDSILKDEEAVKAVTRNIMLAANKMAEAGSANIESAGKWTAIQSELRTGLNVIMDAYRRYIELHRQTCDAIENVAKNMITKYETELSSLDRLSVPTSSNGILEASNPAFTDWFAKMFHMMTYADVHQRTLGTALDCVNDLTRRTLEQREVIMGPPTNTVTVRVVHQADPQNTVRTYDLPCNEPSGYNGCQSCSNALADLTQRYAAYACPGQCPQPPQNQVYY